MLDRRLFHLNDKDYDAFESALKAPVGDNPALRKIDVIHQHERTGRPLGENGFVENLEKMLGRSLQPQKPGPKKKAGG